jgi:hypothetical protein
MPRIRYKNYTFLGKEEIIHFEVLQYMRLRYPQIPVLSNHAQGAITISKKNISALARRKVLNGWSGFPDIIIFHSTNFYTSLGIELKSKKGKVSEIQKIVHESLAKSNMCVVAIGQGIDLNIAIKKSIQVIDSYMSIGEIKDGIL